MQFDYKLSEKSLNQLTHIMVGRKSLTKIDLVLDKFPELKNELNALSKQTTRSVSEVIWILLNGYHGLCRFNNNLSFVNYKQGYSKYCGHYCQCMTADVSAKKKNKTTEQKEFTNKLRESTMLEKYGVRGNFYNGKNRDNIAATMKKKYGVSSPQQSAEIRARTVATNIKKYGAESILSTDSNKRNEINKKLKSNSKERIIKSKETIKKRYNVDNVSQIENVLEKKKNTFLKNYGATHYMQSIKGQLQYKTAISEKYNNKITNIKQLHLSEFALECLHDKTKFSEISSGKTLNEIAELLGIAETTAGKKVIEFNLQNTILYRPHISSGHRQLSQWLSDIGINHINNCRTLISPKEVDIFIPEYNLAIEYCGIYYHTEIRGNKDKNYHRSKYVSLSELGIQLITVYDIEWLSKSNIVKNIILNKLKKNKPTTAARKLNIVTNRDIAVRDLCNKYHIQGAINGKTIALVDHNDDIHAAMILGKNRFDALHHNSWEIYRFFTVGSVPGALSRCLTYFCKHNDIDYITTYVDHRYGTGESYQKIGFVPVRTTTGYQYVDSQLELHNRIKFQKHKLIAKYPHMSFYTEWEIMKQLDYDRIWDCGQTLLTYQVYINNNNIKENRDASV